MAKKRYFSDDEVPIFENRNGAVVYKRGEYWQFRVWLTADNKYMQKSLNTKISHYTRAVLVYTTQLIFRRPNQPALTLTCHGLMQKGFCC